MVVLSCGLWAPASGAGGSMRAASGRTADNDNTIATATALSSGVQVNGEVNLSDDQSDFYKINVNKGQCIKAELSYTCSTNPIYLSLYDPNQNDVLDIQTGNTTRGDTILALENGTHYIEVWTFSAAQNYNLTVTVNDTPIMSPGVQVKGMLSFTGTERSDWYRIWLDGNISGKSEGVWVNMTEDLQTTDFNLFLWDIEFGGMNPYNLSRGASPHETVSCAASFTGWYYLLANSWDGSGGYTLDISRFQTSSDGDNDMANATKVKHNAVIQGRLDQGWDKYDWYRYHLLSDDTFRVTATRASGQDVFYLNVYDSSMTLLAGDLNIQGGAVVNSLPIDGPNAPNDMDYYVVIYSYAAVRSGAFSDDTGKEVYTLTFSSTNRRPEVISSLPDISMDEDTGNSFNLSMHFKDTDGDTIHYNLSGLTNIAATYTDANGTIEFVPKGNWFGKETLTVQADDYYPSGSVTLTCNITVNSVNDLPYVKKSIPDVKMLQGGTDTSIDLSKVFADADIAPPGSDRLNYSVEDNGSVWVDIQANGAVRLTAPNTFFGSCKMNFTATDNDEAMARAICNVTVTHVNQPPHLTARPANISINEDETATLDLSKAFTDPEGDPMSIAPSQMTRITVGVDPNTLVATLKPVKDLSGFFEDIMFTAQDDQGAVGDSVVIRVTVVAVNDPPVFKTLSPTGDVTLIELGSQEFSGSATDIDNSNLNYTWYLDGKDLRISETTYTYVSTYDSAGNHTVKLVVDDGVIEINRVWNVTVMNLNRPPTDVKIVTPRTGESFPQASVIEFEGSAKDLDKDALTYSWMDGKAEISSEKGFTTSALKPGNHNIYLEVSDGTDAVRSKNILITVVANTPPIILGYTPATGQKFTVGQRIAFSVNVRNEEATDNLTFSWSENNGNTVLSTAQSFETSNLKAGTHIITISVNDSFNEVKASVTVEVANPSSTAEMSTRTLGIMAGIVAAVAIIGALAFVMMRRRKTPASASAGQAGPVAQPPAGATAAPAPYQPYSPNYQPLPPPPPPDYIGGYKQPPQAPPQYDSGTYQPPAQGEPGVPPAEAYQQQPAWAMAPPSEPGGGEMVRPAEPVPAQPAPEARPPTEPEQPQG
jgi:hypothetical protein